MFLRCLALALILAVCWAANALAAPPEADESQAMVDAINEARAAQGLPAYRHSPALSELLGGLCRLPHARRRLRARRPDPRRRQLPPAG